jgi:hypothetical protein
MVFWVRRTLRFLMLLLGACFVILLIGTQYVWSVRGEENVSQLPSMALTLVAVNGTQVTINETDIGQLTSYSGFGGYKNQLGNLKGYGNYTGVSLEALCNLVSGLTNTSTVRVTATDNYSMSFTYAEVKGEFVTYDNVTGAEVNHTEPLMPIVAYYLNDSSIPLSDGPLRLAIVSPEGYATSSTYWVKLVVRIEIVETAIPEFPYSEFLSLFLFSSFATVLVLTVQRQRSHCLVCER